MLKKLNFFLFYRIHNETPGISVILVVENFQFHSDNKWKCSFLSCLASEQIHNYTRNMKTMRTFFHCTVSQKEALEINRFSDNSWMNWTFLYIGQEKTKVVGGRLVTVPAHKICTMAKFSKLCPKIMKAYFAL